MPQTEGSVASFGWEWTQQQVLETRATLYRKLFASRGVWCDHYDNKVIADVGSGMGRLTWAMAEMTKSKKIISVELSPEAVAKQLTYIKDPRVEIIQGDIAEVQFKADIIHCSGVIQHTADPLATLKNLINNLNDSGELMISFYLKTLTTQILEPLRFVLSRLPKELLWRLTPLLTPIFMLRKAGREGGIKNARHTAYDWFGSHQYQHYFTDSQIRSHFLKCGIDPNNILKISKGLYRVRKGKFPDLDPEVLVF